MMSETLGRISTLVELGKVEVSVHAVQALIDDGILIEPLLLNLHQAVVVEDYPSYHKGPAVLILKNDEFDNPVHLLWGIPMGESEPAVLITAYRPDPIRWSPDFIKRRHD